MPAILTTASTVTCGHPNPMPPPAPASTVAITSTAKLRVLTAAVLSKENVLAGTVTCGTKPISPPPSTSKPCLSVTTVADSSLTAKLRVGGTPVVTDLLAGETDGTLIDVTPQLLLAALSANQAKLTAV
jgi:hypothetical protein